MRKHISTAEERALGRRLRQEARADWPAYSETLHDRIMSVVKRSQAHDAVVLRRPRADVWLRSGWAAAFAAACLLCIAVFGWRMTDYGLQQGAADRDTLAATGENIPAGPAIAPSPSTPIAETTIADIPLIDELADSAVNNLRELFVSVAITPHSAALKHDTRLAAETLLERLPIDMELVTEP